MESMQENHGAMEFDAAPPAASAVKSAAKKGRGKKVAKKTGKPAAKVAKKRAAKAKSTGTRYSPEFKSQVLEWLHDNPERGSVGQALKKFGISYISLRGWMKKAGMAKPGSTRAKKSVGKRPGKAVRGRSAASAPVFAKQAQQKILKGLARMAHGIEILAEGFGHIT